MEGLGTNNVAVLKNDASVEAPIATLGQLDSDWSRRTGLQAAPGRRFMNFGRLMDDMQYVPGQGLDR